jgi:hypothetical protein
MKPRVIFGEWIERRSKRRARRDLPLTDRTMAEVVHDLCADLSALRPAGDPCEPWPDHRGRCYNFEHEHGSCTCNRFRQEARCLEHNGTQVSP